MATQTEANYYSFLQQNWYKEHYYPHGTRSSHTHTHTHTLHGILTGANAVRFVEHTCFVGVDTPLGTVIAAVKREKDDSGNYQYSIMVLTQDVRNTSLILGQSKLGKFRTVTDRRVTG